MSFLLVCFIVLVSAACGGASIVHAGLTKSHIPLIYIAGGTTGLLAMLWLMDSNGIFPVITLCVNATLLFTYFAIDYFQRMES